MSSEPVISLRHLSKKYPIYDRSGDKFLELLTLRRRQFHREFWALDDVDLEVHAGTTLGIVGQNGSGKSTMLQVVAGIMRQTRGDVQVRGTVAALLELGSGFNPEFTGIENVYMNGAIMGFTKSEMTARMDQILEFADIGEFVHQPVKTYSSGMFMRLAFAVAIHIDPDILLVDEALAVGDIVFQHRCINRINRLREAGKTVLFVTHDLQALTRFCDRAILLDQGHKLEDGTPEHVVQKYQKLIFERESRRPGRGDYWATEQQDPTLQVVTTIPYIHNRFGERGAEILGIILLSTEGEVINEMRSNQEVQLVVSARADRPLEHPIIGFTLRDRLGVEIMSSNTSYEGIHLPAAAAGDVITVGFRIQVPNMRPGSYSLSPAIAEGNIWEHTIHDWIDNALIVNVADTGLIYGMMRWPVQASYNVRR